MITKPLYPDCEVQLVGRDGNAFFILGTVRKALRRHLSVDKNMKSGEIEKELDKFIKEAQESDYDHLLRTCMKWVTVL